MKRPEQPGQARPYHGAVNYTTRLVRAGIALGIMGALGWLGGCSDNPGGPVCCDPSTQGLIVSDPVLAASTAVGVGPASAPASSAGDELAYVALPPGTAPAGTIATIRRVGDAGSIFTTVRNGGFDPVPIAAQAGDSIDIRVTDAGGGTLSQQRVAVLAKRPPVVVRTQPPRRKTDVALNAAIVVVFSEPIAPSSLTAASVRLFRGTSAVPGTIQVLQGTGAAAAFVPSAPLAANTDYRLEVTSGVQDLDGDALTAGVTVAFTTGQSSTGPAASVTVSPDTLYLTGASYQMTATVRDAAGNELIDQSVTWSTSDPAGLAVSPTGLLTALAVGSYHVDATVNGLVGRAEVYVGARPPASIAISPAQATVGAAGDTIILTATARDAAGRLLDRPSVTWSSSDPAVATVAADSSSSLGRAFATVTGVSPGSVTITGTLGAASGTASVTVIPPPPVASVTVTPDSTWLLVQGKVQLSATVRDANGKALGGRAVTWTSDNAAVATVDATGLVTGISVGAATVIATSEGLSDTAAVTVQATVSPVLAFDAIWDIYVTDGKVEANLTNSPSFRDLAPAWSPDGEKIAFVSDRNHYPVYDVYVINADGSALTKLTNYDGGAIGISSSCIPAWSPDGQKIAFASSRGGILEISVMNADGSAQINLTNNAANNGSPVWSPDGQKVAFVSDRDGHDQIYVMNADGTAQTRLTNNAANNGSPVWSPDGQKIAFVSINAGSEIYVINADGSAQTRLTHEGTGPVWSPDGQKIAFASWRDGDANSANLEIYVMNADGTAQTRLTNNAALDGAPAWSPDGQKIAFASDRDGPSGYGEIYIMNADGTTPIRITNHPGSAERPLWRP